MALIRLAVSLWRHLIFEGLPCLKKDKEATGLDVDSSLTSHLPSVDCSLTSQRAPRMVTAFPHMMAEESYINYANSKISQRLAIISSL